MSDRPARPPEPLLPPHGGYRRLKSFRVAQLVYDVTVRFCERYVDRFSRTRDQMVQAARSGVQNIAEGSQASGTSKKTELKLTNVARASLEELRLDYEDFLRQRGLPRLAPDHPALERFRARKCATVEEVRAWVADERRRARGEAHGPTRTSTDDHGPGHPRPSVSVRVPSPELLRPRRQRRALAPQPRLPPPRPAARGPGPGLRGRGRVQRAPLPGPPRPPPQLSRRCVPGCAGPQRSGTSGRLWLQSFRCSHQRGG